MKKILFILLIISAISISYANDFSHSAVFQNHFLKNNEKSLINKMKSDLDSDTKARYAGIAQTAIGSTFLSLGITGWGGIIAGQVVYNGMFVFMGYGAAFLMPTVAHVLTLIGTIFTYTGITFSHFCNYYFYGSYEWKYEMHKMRRNLGIILLGTSAVPLAGLVTSIALLCEPEIDILSVTLFPFIFSLTLSLAHIISGTCIVVGYSHKQNIIIGVCLLPTFPLPTTRKKAFMKVTG